MIKKIILAAIILVSSYSGFSQFTITAPLIPHTVYEGFTVDYIVTYQSQPSPPYDFTISVVNGTVMPTFQTPPYQYIRIKWNCLTPNGSSVTLTDNNTGFSATYNATVVSYLTSTTYCSFVTPEKQNNNYGQWPSILDVTYCSPYCEKEYSYQWEVGDVPIGTFPQEPTSWTDIFLATDKTYQPPIYNNDCIKGYRRKTTFSDVQGIPVTVTSKTGVISTFDFLDPGSITWSNVFNNGVPVITQTPATGGLCDGYNYVYTWELSLDDITYTNIGTGINYPVAVQIPGTCYIRRRVDCGVQALYTTPLHIIVQPLDPGTISGSGTYAFNTIPPVTQTPASGGVCSSPDYVYSWERSINNGPWVTFSIGNSITYPSNGGIIATCRVRRKVHCVYADAHTLPITFTMLPYTSPNVENLNYVRVNDIVIPAVQSWEQADALSTGDKMQTTNYLDGFGRTIQIVAKQGSLKQSGAGNLDPNNISNYQDLVNHVQYDGLGRADKEFLLYSTSTNLGFYKANATTEQQSFTNTKYGEPAGSTFTYSQTTYDGSPINRVINQKLPGYYWNSNPNYKGISNDYDIFKTSTDNVINWDFDYTTGLPVVASVPYADSKLTKNIIKDEKDRLIIEYTDLNDNIILRKVQEDNNPVIGNYAGWLNTYYVYDDFGRLHYTITPKAVAAMALSGNWSIDSDTKNELCFYQEYDIKGRVVVKHSPGGGDIWLVYDNRDRLVLSQDENQRNRPAGKPKQWSFSLYDDNDRAITTGLIDDNITNTRSVMQDYVDGLTQQNQQVSVYTGSSWETITAYNPVAGKKLTTGYYCQYCTESYTNSVNYYDEYPSAISQPYISQTVNNFATTTNQYVEQAVKSLRTKGMVTGTKIRVLDDNYDDGQISNDKFLSSTSYIDERSRVIQTHEQNILTGTDVVSVQYDFVGKVLCTTEKHNAPVSGNPFDNLFIVTSSDYDLMGRAKRLWKLYTKNSADISTTPGTSSSKYKKLSELALDEFGKAKTKQMGKDPDPGATGTPPLEIQDYTYNIQGWLTGINKEYAIANSSSNMLLQWSRKFGMFLGYENGDGKFTSHQWNGNITGVIWRSQGDNTPRKYNYEYDNVNRFTAARFLQKERPQDNDITYSTSKVDLSAFVNQYDPNGNIKLMKQTGITPGTMGGILIDDLSYVYQTNDKGNKLFSITDNAFLPGSVQNGTQGDFKNSGSSPGTFYDYDFNGNLKKDINKNIQAAGGDGIVNNFLDLPQQITVDGKSKTEYTYDAAGNKLKKNVTYLPITVPLNQKTTYYIGDFVYEEATGQPTELQYILNEEGKLRITDVTVIQTPEGVVQAANTGNVDFGLAPKEGVWDYYIKDNLSNTRMVLTEEGHMQLMTCTMEGPNQPLGLEEEANFGNSTNNEVLNTRTLSSVPGWSNNTLASKLQLPLGGTAVGPNVILKVMAGDYINAQAHYFYLANPNPAPPTNVLTNIVQSLFGALTGSNLVSSGVKSGIDQNYLQNNSSGVSPFLVNHPPNGPQDLRPRAYLNYIFFDEQFRYVGDCSNAKMVDGAGDGQPPLIAAMIKATKNGYVYVFLSNETPNMPVYFDNFIVSQNRGPIVEDNAYYPYGLRIQGISAIAAGKFKSKEGYQGDYTEHDEETGYDVFALRNYDPQIGRFVSIDPYDQYSNPYSGMGSDPINSIDEDGGFNGWVGALIGAVSFGVTGYTVANNNIHDDNKKRRHFQSALIGLGSAFLGAGVGYATDMSFFNEASETSNFFANFRSFYGGFFGMDHVNTRSTIGKTFVGYGKDACPVLTPISTPEIWNLNWVQDYHWEVIDLQYWSNLEQSNRPNSRGDQVMTRSIVGNGSTVQDNITTTVPYEEDEDGEPTTATFFGRKKLLSTRERVDKNRGAVAIRYRQSSGNSRRERKIRARIKTKKKFESSTESLKIFGIKIPFIKRRIND